MRIAKREHRADYVSSLKGVAFALLCIVTMLLLMGFLIVGVRFFAV